MIDALPFHSSGLGIGDAVCAYYAACGLADAAKKEVKFKCRHPDWFRFVSHPGVTVERHVPLGPNCNADYERQLQVAAEKLCSSRPQFLCDNLAKSFRLPPFKPAVPLKVIKPAPPPGIDPGYVVVAPFSLHSSREWPPVRWRELVLKLTQTGHRVIAIDGPGDGRRLKGLFGATPITWFWGNHPEWVVALLANASLVIGNDSGMAHVAGLMRVPTRAIMTHVTPEYVFSPAQSVEGISPEGWPCQGCNWQPARGFRPDCSRVCKALVSIGVDRVLYPDKSPESPQDVMTVVAKKLKERAETVRYQFDWLVARPDPQVVETGCVRARYDWSAGYFTWLCGTLLETANKGRLTSVDVDGRNCGVARELCRKLSRVEVLQSDSVEYLKTRAVPADLIYLDSMDTYVDGFDRHALAETQAAETCIKPDGLFVFDDTPSDGNGGWTGKGRLAVPYLIDRGWRVLPESGYQTLLVR